jgi:hypothetical protein
MLVPLVNVLLAVDVVWPCAAASLGAVLCCEEPAASVVIISHECWVKIFALVFGLTEVLALEEYPTDVFVVIFELLVVFDVLIGETLEVE